MTTQTSHIHQTLRLNGHTFRGFADTDRPVELPNVVLATHKFGKDGSLLATATNQQGGEVMLHLLPTSISCKFMIRQMAKIHNGSRIVWRGSYTDSELGTSLVFRGGVLLEAMPGTEPENQYDCKFVFEQIIGQYDGAKFGEPPLLANA